MCTGQCSSRQRTSRVIQQLLSVVVCYERYNVRCGVERDLFCIIFSLATGLPLMFELM